MKTLLLLLTAAFLAQNSGAQRTIKVNEAYGDGPTTTWASSEPDKPDPSKVQWTAQQFKDYCGTLTDCKIPEDVQVLADEDPGAWPESSHEDPVAKQVNKLESRVKALEQAVDAQHWEIYTLQHTVPRP